MVSSLWFREGDVLCGLHWQTSHITTGQTSENSCILPGTPFLSRVTLFCRTPAGGCEGTGLQLSIVVPLLKRAAKGIITSIRLMYNWLVEIIVD